MAIIITRVLLWNQLLIKKDFIQNYSSIIIVQADIVPERYSFIHSPMTDSLFSNQAMFPLTISLDCSRAREAEPTLTLLKKDSISSSSQLVAKDPVIVRISLENENEPPPYLKRKKKIMK